MIWKYAFGFPEILKVQLRPLIKLESRSRTLPNEIRVIWRKPTWKCTLLSVSRQASRANTLEDTAYCKLNAGVDTLLLSGTLITVSMLSRMDFSNVRSLAFSTRFWYSACSDERLEFVKRLVNKFQLQTLILLLGDDGTLHTRITSQFVTPRQQPEAYGLDSCGGDSLSRMWALKEQLLLDSLRAERQAQLKAATQGLFQYVERYKTNSPRSLSEQ